MKKQLLIACGLAASLVFASSVQADPVPFQFSGGGVSGSGVLTVAPDTVADDPGGAYTISNISGTFSDATLGLVNVGITGLVSIGPAPYQGTPYPVSLSFYSVVNPPGQDQAISYDNLFYPGGAPIVCPGYPATGGFLDVYGVMFALSNGDVVDFWSNGAFPGGPPPDYGVLVIDSTTATVIDSQHMGGLAAAVPEPGSLCLLATGLIGAVALRRRRSATLPSEVASAA